jgi:translation initiation factor IF-2
MLEEQRLQKEKVRVFELARELDLESKDLMVLCRRHGIELKNQLSNVSTEQRDQIIELVKRGSAAAPQAPRSAAPVIPAVINRKVQSLDTRRPAPAAKPTAPVAAPPVPEESTPVALEPAASAPPQLPTPAPSITPAVSSLEIGGEMPAAPQAGPSSAPAVSPSETPEPVIESVPAERPSIAASLPAAPTSAAEPLPAVKAPMPPMPPRTKVPDLGGSRPGGDSNRAPRTLRPGGNRPVLRQTGAPGGVPRNMQPGKPAEAKKPVEKIMQPIVAFTKEDFEKARERPLRPEDVMRPGGVRGEVVPPVVDDEEDSEAKKKGGGSKDRPGSVSGRKQRQEERNKRAAERKGRSQEIEVQLARGVTDVDVLERPRSGSLKQKLKKKKPTEQRKGRVPVVLPITVRSLSEAIGMRVADVLIKLVQAHNLDMRTTTINSTVDPDLAMLFALEHGCELEIKRPVDAEELLLATYKREDPPESLLPRAPIVTIMGHVDHGKTSLLDRIRSSNVAASEAGGITQVIRAWRVDHGGRPITFLDTPGHEAFTKMRARGAQVTDVAVIVVAAEDGVMPQTEEAINHAKAAGVALVIAINKVDLPNANVNRTRQQLYGLGIIPDNMGGEVPFVETSAATGKGIDELLDQISIVAELKELKANPDKPAQGTCLEAMLSEGEGVRATLLVREGTLRRGDILLCGAAYGRVRQMYDDIGRPIQEAGPSAPVRITGLDQVPNADDPFLVVPELSVARDIADKRKSKQLEASLVKRTPMTLEQMTGEQITELKVILKADFRGSIEAIRKELEKLQHEEVRVRLLETAIGAITENDVWLALTSPEDTIIVGFNVVPDDRALALAEEKGVQIRQYDVIYNLTDDIKSALEGKLKPKEEVIHLGRALVRETFKISRVGTIAGCHVTQGTIKRSAKIRLIRDGVVIYPPVDRTAGLESLKRFKEDVSEVRDGFECGIKIAGYDDVKVGDLIEAYRVDQVQRKLEYDTDGGLTSR